MDNKSNEEIIDYKKMNLDTDYTGQSKEKTKKADTYSYKGWLISDNFFKRCFASLGYHMMGALLIYLGILAVVIALGIITAAVSGLLRLAS